MVMMSQRSTVKLSKTTTVPTSPRADPPESSSGRCQSQ
jgi:hypothetical protein